MARDQSLMFAFLLSCSLLLHFSIIPVLALNIGIQTTQSAFSMKRNCSRTCESEFCSVPPFLRYGKFCGLLYGGCPGEQPCDDLDACCMKHDACIGAKNNYLSKDCNQGLLDCMAKFKNLGKPTFMGNKCHVKEVVHLISIVMKAAVVFHKQR